jgi:flagellar protein FliO/FliZ
MRSLHAIFPAAVVGCLLSAPVAFAATDSESQKLNLSDEPAAEAARGASGGSIVRTRFGLAVVLGVIYGLHWLLKQAKKAKDSTASGPGLESLATLPLGTNRSLHLVRVGGEIVLLGVADNAVTPIRRYSEQDARTLGLLDGAPATLADLEPTPAPKGLIDILRAKTVVK